MTPNKIVTKVITYRIDGMWHVSHYPNRSIEIYDNCVWSVEGNTKAPIIVNFEDIAIHTLVTIFK